MWRHSLLLEAIQTLLSQLSSSTSTLVPAQITSLPNISAVNGTVVTMTCEARGTPPLSFAWTFNDAPLVGVADSSNTRSSITVGGVIASTEGVYRCTATNNFGSDQKDAKLSVIREFL